MELSSACFSLVFSVPLLCRLLLIALKAFLLLDLEEALEEASASSGGGGLETCGYNMNTQSLAVLYPRVQYSLVWQNGVTGKGRFY